MIELLELNQLVPRVKSLDEPKKDLGSSLKPTRFCIKKCVTFVVSIEIF